MKKAGLRICWVLLLQNPNTIYLFLNNLQENHKDLTFFIANWPLPLKLVYRPQKMLTAVTQGPCF